MASASQGSPSPTPQPDPAPSCRACGHPRPANRTTSYTISSLDKLSNSSTQGCQTCSLLLQGIERYAGDRAEKGDMLVRIEINISGTQCLDIQLLGSPVALSFFVSPNALGRQDLLRSWPVCYSVPEDTASSESFQWATRRIQDCDSHHEHCRVASAAALPERVLDVGGFASNRVTLYTSSGESGRYACLSHCWGPRPFLRTLSSNLNDHGSSIPWHRLPLTFQEAITFTRRLGIRYLWIDSLCIIQDDDDDWRREGAKMASIFMNAYITIAAAHSDGANGGLFSTLGPDFEKHGLRIPTTHTGDDEQGIFVRRRIPHVNRHRPNTLAAGQVADQDFPILQRGWVYQERCLSSRVLYFGSKELSWECAESNACQCSGIAEIPLAVSGAHLAADTDRVISPRRCYKPSMLDSISRAQGKEAVMLRWLKLVEDYSELDLTFERDIFPALSGLAKEYGAILETRYCAGLWESFALQGLLWFVEARGGKTWGARPLKWRAPTWSWAAVNSPVSFVPAGELTHRCEVVSIDCGLIGPDPTGELSNAHIILRGPLVPSTLQYKTQNREHSWGLFDLYLLHGWMGNARADFDSAVEGPQQISPGTEIAYFHIGQRVDSAMCLLLILRPVHSLPDSLYPTYERIGLVELFGQQIGRIPVYENLVAAVAKETTIRII